MALLVFSHAIMYSAWVVVPNFGNRSGPAFFANGRVGGLGLKLSVYLHHARRLALFALLPAIVVALLVAVIDGAQPKQYQATSTLYVQQAGSAASGLAQNIAAANEFATLMQPSIVAPDINRLMHKRYPGFYLDYKSYSTSVPKIDNIPIFFVQYQDGDPRKAQAAANTAAQVIIQHVQQLQLDSFTSTVQSLQRQFASARKNIDKLTKQINTFQGSPSDLANLQASLQAYKTRYLQLQNASEQLRTQRDTVLNSISVFQPAGLPITPSSPHPLKLTLLGFLAAFLLGAGGLYAREYMKDSPRTPEAIEDVVGAPILGSVPRFDVKQLKSALVTDKAPLSMASEAYRVIRTNVQFSGLDKPAHVIVVTSPNMKEGKTTTASNLARVFADSGNPVLLLDGDLRRPGIQKIFGLDGEKGLTNLLLGEPLNGHARPEDVEGNLRIISAGPRPANPADVLGSDRMRSVLEQLRQTAPLIFIDTPPILAASDARVLAAQTDGVILVVDPDRSTLSDIRRSREAIEAVGGRIIGVVLNGVQPRNPLYIETDYKAYAAPAAK